MDWLTDSRSLGKDGRKEESRWPLTQVKVIQRSFFPSWKKKRRKWKKRKKRRASVGTVFTNDNCVTGGGSLICLTSGSCRCLCPPAQHTHRNTHTAQVVLLLWGPQSVYTLKGQKASPHNANCSTLTGPCQVGTEFQIHTEMNRQWSGGGDPKLRKGTNQGSTIHREHIQKPSK